MSLKAKVILLLVLAIAASALVAAANYYYQERVRESGALAQGVLQSVETLQTARVAERDFLREGRPELAAAAEKGLSKAREILNRLLDKASGDEELAKRLASLSHEIGSYHKLFSQVKENVQMVMKLRAQQMGLERQIVHLANSKVLEVITQMEGEYMLERGEPLPTKFSNFAAEVRSAVALMDSLLIAGQGLFLNQDEKSYLKELARINKLRKLYEGNARNLASTLGTPKLASALDEILSLHQRMAALDVKLYKLWKQNRQLMNALDKSAKSLCADASRLKEAMQAEVGNTGHLSTLVGLSVAAAAAAMILIWGFYIIRSTFRPLRQVVGSLGEVVNQVETSSAATLTLSQKMAERAAEQAASLEETSASLEEITSMTNQNAENADEMRSAMTGAEELVQKATGSMVDVNKAMGDISTSSEEISKIIKTIDEIAFQTNLLALNAAVEAARAGEQGAGFAVVADEVRSLAMRAAESAKDIQVLIEEAITQVRRGVGLVEQTDGQFKEVVEATSKSTALVYEIAEASNEQRNGLNQISQAVIQMDEVTQRNAAEASDASDAAKQMGKQAKILRQVTGDLIQVIEGTDQPSRQGKSQKPRRRWFRRKKRAEAEEPTDEMLALPGPEE